MKRFATTALVATLLSGTCAFRAQAQQAPAMPPASAPAQADERPVLLPQIPVDTLSAIRARGELRVGVALFIPWAMHDKNGELMGYEIDLARKLAEDLGVKAKFEVSPQPGLLPELHEGSVDVLISGLNVTPQRALMADFSHPTGHSEVYLLASRALAKGWRRTVDFNRPEVKIAARAGTTSEAVVRQLFPKARLVEVGTDADAYDQVREGKVHGLVGYSPVPEAFVGQYGERVFLPLSEPVARYAEAFAVRSGDQRLLNYLNSWITYYEQSGWLAERRSYWFKSFASWEGNL